MGDPAGQYTQRLADGTVPDERKEKSDWMDTIHRDARYGDAHSSDHPHPVATGENEILQILPVSEQSSCK